MTRDDTAFCDNHAYVRDDETTLGDPYADREAAARNCARCAGLRSFISYRDTYDAGYRAGRRALANELADLIDSMGDRGDHEFGWKDPLMAAIVAPGGLE